MKILVYVESKEGKAINGALEVLGGASAMGEVTAVVVGDAAAAEQVAACGIKTLNMDIAAENADVVVAALQQAAAADGYDAVLMSATLGGKDYAPRLAARLATGCVTDVTAIETEGDKILFTRPAYGGTVLEKVEVSAKPAVATVRSGSFTKVTAGAAAAVETVAVQLADDAVKAKIAETAKEIAETVNLEGADVIVSGGRGMGSAEGFKLVEELAEVLGGVVGASRPAIEDGWVSRAHQVGQSGKIVAPKLYIACGISGAMQHISGMMGSKYIVAINKDEDASIFDIADVGIVGKCEDVIPMLIDEIKKARA